MPHLDNFSTHSQDSTSPLPQVAGVRYGRSRIFGLLLFSSDLPHPINASRQSHQRLFSPTVLVGHKKLVSGPDVARRQSVEKMDCFLKRLQ